MINQWLKFEKVLWIDPLLFADFMRAKTEVKIKNVPTKLDKVSS